MIGASGITYDPNGNATGQTALPIQSWTGNASLDALVNQVEARPAACAGDPTVLEFRKHLSAWEPVPEFLCLGRQSIRERHVPRCVTMGTDGHQHRHDDRDRLVAEYGKQAVGDAY